MEFQETKNPNIKIANVPFDKRDELRQFMNDSSNKFVNIPSNFPTLKKEGDTLTTKLTGDIRIIQRLDLEDNLLIAVAEAGSILIQPEQEPRIIKGKSVKVTLESVTDEVSNNGTPYQKKRTSFEFV